MLSSRTEALIGQSRAQIWNAKVIMHPGVSLGPQPLRQIEEFLRFHHRLKCLPVQLQELRVCSVSLVQQADVGIPRAVLSSTKIWLVRPLASDSRTSVSLPLAGILIELPLQSRAVATVKLSQKLGRDLDRLDRPVGRVLDLDFYFAILAVVAERAAEAALVVQVESHAGINRQGIDVQAHAAGF